MTTQRKTVLIAGLGEIVSNKARETLEFDPSQTPDLVDAEVKKAKAGGFDSAVFVVEPWDAAGTLDKLKDELQKQRWDGFSIGYAARGLKETTKLFEDMINLAAAVSPGTRFLFPLGREDIWEAIQRAFDVSK